MFASTARPAELSATRSPRHELTSSPGDRGRALAPTSMTPFATFALLYMTAVFLELAESWRHPVFTAAMLALIIALVCTRITRVTFLVFLASANAHFLVVQFPDVANHVNLMIYCNTLMIVGIVHSLLREGAVRSDDDWFESTRPVLQVTMILVYFLAGFHKLNADFVNPDVSCVGSTVRQLWRAARSDVLGVPTSVVLAGGIAAAAYWLLASSPLRRHLPLIRAGAAAAVLLAALFAALPLGAGPPGRVPLVLALVAVILAWELVGGLLLAVPGLQLPVLVFSWTMHASLALVGFVDFGSLALALLFTFVPPAYAAMPGESLPVRAGGRPVYRVHLYVALAVVVGFVGLRSRLAAGILFNAAALVVIWPMLSALVGRSPRPAWAGVRITSRSTPRWLLAFPVLLVLHASTSYLGLRTAGNFSMFSNLRTEGERSNHFLLGGQPLKVWGYQEDVVRFISIDDRAARIGYQYRNLRGNLLPVVEFRKLIYQWTKAGRTVPLTFEYRGVVHSTADIANDPAWRTPARDAEMRLLDFRLIQPEGPNRCRW
jgi:hypothetical protein